MEAIFNLEVRNSWQRPEKDHPLRVDGEEGGDAERDPGHGVVRLEPEGVPRDKDDDEGGDVRVEEEVADQALEGERDLQAGELVV